jgi:hypothetical protein
MLAADESKFELQRSGCVPAATVKSSAVELMNASHYAGDEPARQHPSGIAHED